MENSMKRYYLEGTAFWIDIQKERLIEADNPRNVIPFKKMEYMGNHYILSYNPGTKKAINYGYGEYADGIELMVPQMVGLDPEGMAQKYGLSVGQLKGRSDFDLIVDQQALKERMAGKQITVDILGHLFYVDAHWEYLRPKDDFANKGISLEAIGHYQTEDGKRYIFPYDPKARMFTETVFSDEIDAPAHLKLVSVPSLPILDAYGYARKHGLDMKQALMKHPIKPHVVAKLFEWPSDAKKRMEQKATREKQPSKTVKRKKGQAL